MEIKKFSPDNIPLLEFDPDKMALIEPHRIFKMANLPEYCVLPFYPSLIENLKQAGKLVRIHELSISGISLLPFDLYKTEFEKKSVTVAFPGVGAPYSAAIFEELIASGCRKFVACGWCGVLKPELKNGEIIIPAVAVRDEGTSYHYLSQSRTVEMDTNVVKKLETVLEKHHIAYETGKNWTTDAFYRETRGKIAIRKAEGCISVDMECSALLAVSQFRGVSLGLYMTASDNISGDTWDTNIERGFDKKEKLFWLSVEACLSL
jgi:uridine phosphorylase